MFVSPDIECKKKKAVNFPLAFSLTSLKYLCFISCPLQFGMGVNLFPLISYAFGKTTCLDSICFVSCFNSHKEKSSEEQLFSFKDIFQGVFFFFFFLNICFRTLQQPSRIWWCEAHWHILPRRPTVCDIWNQISSGSGRHGSQGRNLECFLIGRERKMWKGM